MDIGAQLQIDSSLARMRAIADFVMEDTSRFNELMRHFFSEDYRVSQRASNVVNRCVEKENALIYPYLQKVVDKLQRPIHDAFKRNSIRMMQYIELPDEQMGPVADICFNYLGSEREPIAVRAFAMQVLFNICQKYPEIKPELIMMIEDLLPYGSAGIKARGKNILKKLRKS